LSIIVAFRSEVKATFEDINNNETRTFADHRTCLEHYIFLIYWLLEQSEEAAKSAAATAASKSKVSLSRDKDGYKGSLAY
jgi:hypothetical protein